MMDETPIEQAIYDHGMKLVVGLRLALGIDEEVADAFIRALQDAAVLWKDSNAVPKKAMIMLAGFTYAIDACRYVYPEKEWESLNALIMNIDERIGEVLRVPADPASDERLDAYLKERREKLAQAQQ